MDVSLSEAPATLSEDANAFPLVAREDEPENPVARSSGDTHPPDWREELSERVENYRKRRARQQSNEDQNLELDFGASQEPEDFRSLDDALRPPVNRVRGFDLNIGDSVSTQGQNDMSREILSSERIGDETMQSDGEPGEVEGMSLGEPTQRSSPMEIVVGPPVQTAPAEQRGTGDIYLAPLGRRFMAGLTDAVVLTIGAAIFATIFWRFGGRIALVPLNLAILASMAMVLILGYFAAFTAIASATPGLLWMGCEIRNMGGDPPTISESLWRAFGVVVSISALMLGFVWACVDSDSLTWHDRMSGTVITLAGDSTDGPKEQA